MKLYDDNMIKAIKKELENISLEKLPYPLSYFCVDMHIKEKLVTFELALPNAKSYSAKLNKVIGNKLDINICIQDALARKISQNNLTGFPGIKHIIAVGSAKGGVGKSTTSIQLANSLNLLGLKVGLLDADIYGPSIPIMTGQMQQGKPELNVNKKMLPHEIHGLKTMSIGYLIQDRQAMIWRGPIVSNVLLQLLHETDWTPLDILVIDLPPGTGDIQLTMLQKIPLTGAVIVTTPQDVAWLDASRSIAMFEKLKVPILGIVENMSSFICPHCEYITDIFGHNDKLKQDERYCGSIPLKLEIRQSSDTGQLNLSNELKNAYLKITCKLLCQLASLPYARKLPQINISITTE